MSSTYDIVPYSPALRTQILDVQTHGWGPSTTSNSAYFQWKYERNPYQEIPLIYLARCGGEVVGMRGFFGVKWEIGTPPGTFPALYADDLVIAPGHRNRGLITKIMRAAFQDLAERGHEYVFNLSSVKVTTLSSLAMGWRIAGSLQPLRRRSRRAELFSSLPGHIGSLPFLWRCSRHAERLMGRLHPLRRLDEIAGRHPHKDDPRLSVRRDPEPEAMSELVERIPYDGRIRHVRDATYFAWRFRNPRHRYRFLFWKENRLEGYLVLKENVPENTNRVKVDIVDWEATSVPVRAELLRAAIRWGGFSELLAWSASLSDETRSILREAGFRPIGKPAGITHFHPYILVRHVKDEIRDEDWVIAGRRLTALADWDVRLIYSMHG